MVVVNVDCIGFTGTPFIDNYPTFACIRDGREDAIPSLIDRGFHAYTSDDRTTEQFEERFVRFQGQNNNVLVEHVPSDFVNEAGSELATLEYVFVREEEQALAPAGAGSEARAAQASFNVLVDLCGIFKRSSIHEVRDLVLRHCGPDRFHCVYHIDQADSSDRVLSGQLGQ